MLTKKNMCVLGFISVAFALAVFFMWQYGRSPHQLSVERGGATEIVTTAFGPSGLTAYAPEALEARSAIDPARLPFAQPQPIPTNQWYSSLFFQKNGSPLFAFPWSVAFTNDGFQAGLPAIVSQPGIVTGGASSDIVFKLGEEHSGTKVEEWDDLSILTSVSVGSAKAFSLRIVRGSPFLWLEAAKDRDLMFHTDGVIIGGGTGRMPIEVGGRSYALYFDPLQFDAEPLPSNNDLRLRAKSDEALVALAILPLSSDIDRFADKALDPVEHSRVEYGRNGDAWNTAYELLTRSGGPTIFGLLPHHRQGTLRGALEDFGSLQTVRGEEQLRLGKKFDIAYPPIASEVRLDLAALSVAERESLRTLVKEDAAKLSFAEQDTYFAGKRLVAAAQLLSLAHDLGEEAVASDIARRLSAELGAWRDATVGRDAGASRFTYDPVVLGVVGYPSSFGSELYNDHHFHYGYFIAAAAVLGEYDQKFVAEYAPLINLLIADVATTERDHPDFPYLRSFDPYESHSWAAGQSLFPDGNNQESTSEAIQAWHAIGAWARLVGSSTLENAAEILYHEESQSAWAYWLRPAWSAETDQRFAAPIVSLLWGGKAEYATWFSPTSEAKIGIELLPLGTQSGYLAADPGRLKTILAAAPFAPGSVFRDAQIMALALVDPELARSRLSMIEDRDIDTWNTRSYLTAWVMSARVLAETEK